MVSNHIFINESLCSYQLRNLPCYIFNIYFYEYECFACVYFVYPMGPVLVKDKGVLGSLTWSYSGCWEPDSCPLQEHQTFLIAEPSLQPQCPLFLNHGIFVMNDCRILFSAYIACTELTISVL